MGRGYVHPSSTKLVGDRYGLDARQRLALTRSCCSDQQARERNDHRIAPADIHEKELWIDGYNVITSLEAAMAGGVILVGRDGCYRDMASMHGTYRKVEETQPALQMAGEFLKRPDPAACHWLLDQPVSNSGRLKTMMRELSDAQGWNWEIHLVPDPDPVLAESPHAVATADSQILDRAGAWLNLARSVIDAHIADAWIVDFGSGADPE